MKRVASEWIDNEAVPAQRPHRVPIRHTGRSGREAPHHAGEDGFGKYRDRLYYCIDYRRRKSRVSKEIFAPPPSPSPVAGRSAAHFRRSLPGLISSPTGAGLRTRPCGAPAEVMLPPLHPPLVISPDLVYILLIAAGIPMPSGFSSPSGVCPKPLPCEGTGHRGYRGGGSRSTRTV